MKKNNVFIGIVIFVLLIVISLTALFTFNYINKDIVTKKTNQEYTLIIDDRDKYILNIYEDRIEVHSIVQLKCGIGCDPAEEEYVLNFSEQNINKIKNFIYELFKEKEIDEININLDDLSGDDLNILNAIMFDSETYLTSTQKSIYFTLQSQRIDCLTSKLYVYNDNTYEFENTFGKFNYDVNKIIENASKYEDDYNGPYVLTINDGKKLELYSNNIELKEFLSEINVSLDSCMGIY